MFLNIVNFGKLHCHIRRQKLRRRKKERKVRKSELKKYKIYEI